MKSIKKLLCKKCTTVSTYIYLKVFHETINNNSTIEQDFKYLLILITKRSFDIFPVLQTCN